MFEQLSIANSVCLTGLAAASLTDFKTREVPDWISYSLIVFSLGNSLLMSIIYQNTGFFVNALLGGVIGFLIGIFMFYAGQWGGGDSKLTIGICSILGLTIPSLSNISSSGSIVIFVFNTLLVGAAYGLIYTLILASVKFKEIKEHLSKNHSSKKELLTRVALFAIFIISTLFNLISKSLISMSLSLLTGASLLLIYIWILVASVEKTQMIKKISVDKLTEGDWICEAVVKNGNIIFTPAKTGIDLESIKLLKKNNIQQVTVKEGIPFVPSLLISFLITILMGNWLIYLI